MSSELVSPRATERFRRWKNLHLIDQRFPALRRIDFSTDARSMFKVDEHLEKIWLKLGQATTAVTVSPGHGCTTLHDYFVREIDREAHTRRLIPIVIAGGHATRERAKARLQLDDVLRVGLLRDLVRDGRHWDLVGGEAEYIQAINALDQPDLDAYKADLFSSIVRGEASGEIDQAIAAAQEASFTGPVLEIVRRVSELLRVRPLLFFDLSGSKSPDEMNDLWSAIKNFGRTGPYRSRDAEALKSIVSFAIFMPTTAMGAMENYLGAPPNLYEMPMYQHAEIFQMLAYHYRPRVPDDAPIHPLEGLIDPDFMKAAYDERLPIHEIVARFKSALLNLLDEDVAIPYKLEVRR